MIRTPARQQTDVTAIRWRRVVPVLLMVALAVHVLLPQVTDLRTSLNVLRHLRWWAVTVALLMQAGSYWQYGATVRAAARTVNASLSLRSAAAIALGASVVGVCAGGAIGYAAASTHWLRQRGYAGSVAAVCGWLPGLMNAVVAMMFGLFSAILLISLAGTHVRDLPIVIGAMTLSALMIGALIAVGTQPGRTRALFRFYVGLRARLARRPVDRRRIVRLSREVTDIRHVLTSGGWKGPLRAAFASMVFDIGTLVFLFVATHSSASILTMLAGYGIAAVGTRIPILPGGIGLVEGGLVAAYTALGVPAATAVVITLVYRLLSFWLPTITGIPCAISLERRGPKH